LLVQLTMALDRFACEDDTFIGARPTPILACGIYGLIRNTVDVAVMDVEQFPEVGKTVGASAALAEPILRELIVHPVGQFVAVRKLPVPNHLTEYHHTTAKRSRVLADPWPSALQYLNGSGFGDLNQGITAVAASPNGRFIAVCERFGTSQGDGNSPARLQHRTSFLRQSQSMLETINVATSRIKVYFSATGMELTTLEYCTDGADWTSVAFSSDSMHLATVCDNDVGKIILWNWYTPEVQKKDIAGGISVNEEEPIKQHHVQEVSPLAAKANLPFQARINRVRFRPTATAYLEELPPVLTTSGDGHLSFWSYEPSEEDPHHVGVLESKNAFQKPTKAYFTDHIWITTKKSGFDTYPLLVALRYKDDSDDASIYCFDQDAKSVCGAAPEEAALSIKLKPFNGFCCAESLCAIPGKGFVVVGACGLVAFISVKPRVNMSPGNVQLAPELTLSGILHLGSTLPNDSVFSSSPSDTSGACRWFTAVSYLPLTESIILYTKDNQLLDLSLSSVEGKIDPEVGSPTNYLSEVFANGAHCGAVLSMDVAKDKPYAATVAKDGAVRVWNLVRGACEICFKCTSVGDEPVVVAFHPTGNLLAVGFRDRLRLFNVLHKPASLAFQHDWQVKGVRALSFDAEGRSLAAAVGINVMVFDPMVRSQKGITLTGHIKPVRVLRWSPSGGRLWTTGSDGNVFGWNLTHPTEPGKRVDDLQLLNRSGVSAAYLALIVRTDDNEALVGQPKEPFITSLSMISKIKNHAKHHRGTLSVDGKRELAPRSSSSGAASSTVHSEEDDDVSISSQDKSIGKGSAISLATGELSYAVVAGIEGGLREVRWDRGLPDSHSVRDIPGPIYTSLELDDTSSLLYAGTIEGSIRVFRWPLSDIGAHIDFPAHTSPPRVNTPQPTATPRSPTGSMIRSPSVMLKSQTSAPLSPANGALPVGPTISNSDFGGAVSAIRLTRGGRVVLSCGGDGSFISHAVAMMAFDERVGEEVTVRSATSVMPLNAAEEAEDYNTDTVMVGADYLDDLHHLELEMTKNVADLHSDLDFSLHQLNTDSADKLKKTLAAAKRCQEAADKRYSELEADVDEMKKKNKALDESASVRHSLSMATLEGKYEQQLGESMARFEKMSAAVLNVKTNAARVLEEREVSIKKELKRRARRDGKRARLLQAHADKLGEEYRHGNRFHRMSLLQQETEYENEVSRLMESLTKELKEQRLLTVAFKSAAQLANTKSKQIARRLEDMEITIQQSEKKSAGIHETNEALAKRVDDLEKEVASKQQELDACEEEEKAMTAQHQRLETFRFVLKAKSTDMELEKTPLQEAVTRLGEAKSEANNVLIAEFAAKAKAAKRLEEMQKQEIEVAEQVKEMNVRSARLEQRIESFKRELCSLVEGNLLQPDLLRTGAVALAKRYLFDESGPTSMSQSANQSTSQSSSKKEHESARETRLLNEAAESFKEVRLREEMAAVVRERNLMQAEVRALGGAISRVIAASKRAAIVRVAENTFMIDECNRLRRDNLQTKREQMGLDHQVSVWGESANSYPNTESASATELGSPSVASMDASLPSTVVAQYNLNRGEDGVSVGASTHLAGTRAHDTASLTEHTPRAPPEAQLYHPPTLPLIRPPAAPTSRPGSRGGGFPSSARSSKGSKPPVPVTLRGSLSALSAAEMEGDEIAYALQRSRIVIASQQAELNDLRRAAHGLPPLRPARLSTPPSSRWLNEEDSETRTQKMDGYGAAEEASVISFASSLSNEVATVKKAAGE